MTAKIPKIVRLAGVALALTSLLIFATIVGSVWHNHTAANDSGCPYCHLGHQTPIQPEGPSCVRVLCPVAALTVLEVALPSASAVFSQIAPRAPPAA